MVRIIILVMALMLVFGVAAQAQEERLPVKDIPREEKSLNDFIPHGWVVEEKAEGDLNGDGSADIAAILIRADDTKNAESERNRGLVVLLRKGDKVMLAGTNDRLLQCKDCGGIKGSVGLGIKKGVILVSQLMGSREFMDGTWRFRYDLKTSRFALIGKDIESGDGMRGTGKVESCNYLTGLKITRTYRYDEKVEKKIFSAPVKGSCAKKIHFLEDIEAEY
jgi:hypothetical protein